MISVISLGRNSDFKSIIQRLQFPSEGAVAVYSEEEDLSGDIPLNTRPGNLIADHEIVFWLGDLNYRYDHSLTVSNWTAIQLINPYTGLTKA